ncbi:response regulator [Halorientalis halophila]|uniref:response regulator n=1 Tax=Halorientalis halophila TaxID=3108499 RepID=UPI00300957B8
MVEPTDEALPRALVVDDEREVADAYALRLRGVCDVETAYDGEAALRAVDDRRIDVVLLDRHMPGLSGDEVLERLEERDFPGRIVMITAIDPGFDILDMPFDDYLCKPVDREDVQAAVTHQCTILGYETLGEYFGVESKRRVVAAELSADECNAHDEYQALETSARDLEQRARRLLTDTPEILSAFENVDRESK